MHRRWAFVALVALALGSLAGYAAARSDPQVPSRPIPAATAERLGAAAGSLPGILLVRFKPHLPAFVRERVEARAGVRSVRRIGDLDTDVVRVAPSHLRRAWRILVEDAYVRLVERDPAARLEHASCVSNPGCVVPNDSLFYRQWDLQNDSSTQPWQGCCNPGPPTAGADIDAGHAWAVTRGDSSVTVAVVDSGIDTSHPELAGRVVGSVSLNGSTTTDDTAGHGTGVAGIIGAIPDNGAGIAGVDWNARLLDVKVRSDDPNTRPTSCDVIAQGITWATDHGAQVINVSLGLGAGCDTLQAATDYAWNHGALIVASAGNGSASYHVYPAAYPHVIAVAATDDRDQLASFSQYGSWIQLAAPGVGIPTLFPTHANSSGIENYGYDNGTSDSAPLVAGAAALVWPLVKDTNGDGRVNDEVQQRLLQTAEAIPGTGTDFQYGRLNVCRAVASDPSQCDTPPPVPPQQTQSSSSSQQNTITSQPATTAPAPAPTGTSPTVAAPKPAAKPKPVSTPGRCAPRDLRVRVTGSRDHGATFILAISFENISRYACTVDGIPSITLLRANDRRIALLRAAHRHPLHRIILKPRQTIYNTITLPGHGHAPSCQRAASLRVRLPGNRQTSTIKLHDIHAMVCGRQTGVVHPLAASPHGSLMS